MNALESKKSKRRKNKKTTIESAPAAKSVSSSGDAQKHAADFMDGSTVNVDSTNIKNINLLHNSDVISKIEQMMDAGEDPIPNLDTSHGTNPFYSGDKCWICHKTKDASDLSYLDGQEEIEDQICENLSFTQCNTEEEEDDDEDDDDEEDDEDEDDENDEDESDDDDDESESFKLDESLSLKSAINTMSSTNVDISVSPFANPISTSEITNANLSCCHACQERRELENEQEREALQLQQCWNELRQAIRQLYQNAGVGCSDEKILETPKFKMETLKEIVHKLCVRSPHQLFIWLESQGQELVVEMKINLLKHLGNGTKSPQQAKLFIAAMLDDYVKLCSACKAIRPIVKELERDHLKKLSLNWELINHHLFQSIIYADHRVQNALPCLITQLKSANVDENEQKQMMLVLQKYLKFDEQMTIIAVMWRKADPLIQEFNIEQASLKAKQRKLHDWEFYKIQRKISVMKKGGAKIHRCLCEECTIKYMFDCGLLPSADSTTPASSDSSKIHDSNNPYLPSGCISSVVNSMDAFESIHCSSSAPSIVGLSLSKDHCCSGIAMQNGIGHLSKTLCPEKEIHRWPQPPVSSVITSDLILSHHSHCDSKQEQNGVTTATTSISQKSNNVESTIPIEDHHITENHVCQCNLCLATNTSSSGGGFSASSVVSSEKTNVERPCECHACVHNADRATIPTVVSVPPRPAAFHLYPHIHGANTTPHALHSSHLFKPPFLHSRVYDVHLPSVSRSKQHNNGAHGGDIISQENSNVFHGGFDWDAVYSNSKMFCSPRKCGNNGDDSSLVCSSASTTGGLSVRDCGENLQNETIAAKNLTNENDSGSADICATVPPTTDVESATLPIVTLSSTSTHSNKATQASGALGCLQSVTNLPHPPLDFHHVKSHPLGAHSHNNSQTRHDYDGVFCSSTHDVAYGMRTTGTNGKVASTMHSCGAAVNNNSNHPVKHPCKGILEPKISLPETQSQSPLGLCPNQNIDSFHGDAEESVDDSCSERSSSTSTSNQKDGKHCDCCYCEVFGHDVASLPQTSRNYTEMRDKLRLRLNRKKMECKNEVINSVNKPDPREDCRDLDLLISYINGSHDNNEKVGPTAVLTKTPIKPSKKLSKKQKKVTETRSSSRLISNKEEIALSAREKENSEFKVCKYGELKDALPCDVIMTPSIAAHGTTISLIKRESSPVTLTSSQNDSNSKRSKLKAKVVIQSEGKTHKSNGDVRTPNKAKAINNSFNEKLESAETILQQLNLPSELSITVRSSGNTEKPTASVLPPFSVLQKLQPCVSPCKLVNPAVEKAPIKKKRKASQQWTDALTYTSDVTSVNNSPEKVQVSSSSKNLCDQVQKLSLSGPESGTLESRFVAGVCSLSEFKKKSGFSADHMLVSLTVPAGGVSVNKNNSSTSKTQHLKSKVNGNSLANLPVDPLCNGSDKNNAKKRSALPSEKTTGEENRNTGNHQYIDVQTSSVLRPKLKNEDKRKPETFPQNSVTLTADSALHKVSDDSSKINGKLPTADSHLQSPGRTCGKNKRSKKKAAASTDSNSIDDVFVPRDIDLDNGELDEMERELEAFKRFCWNSKPLANKEKVHVNLKDIVLRKKTVLGCS